MRGSEQAATIRDATAADFSEVVRINLELEHFLSAMTLERLTALHEELAVHRVACIDGKVQAFLMAFREGANYDSPNYRWFAQRYSRFLYIDRIVVSPPAHGHGLGTLLYEDLFALARQNAVHRVTCEFDIDPPNPVSARFHGKFGFSEVGRQQYGQAGKTVALQEMLL